MPKRFLIAATVEPELVARLQADPRFDVVVRPVTSEDELVDAIAGAHVLMTRAFVRVTRRVIDSAPELELIAQASAGTDNIDTAAAADRGITVINLPGVNANAVAEMVIGITISLTRTLPLYTQEVRGGRWHRDDSTTRHELHHYRLGIIGLGRVGAIVSRLASAFGMPVEAYDPYISDDDFEERGAIRMHSLEELLDTSDIVTLHVPLTDETRRMIGVREIATLRRGSFLINAARGEVLDQRAALDALASGHLAGLALDVFDPEPPLAPFPDDPRLILTPHVGGGTWEAKAAAIEGIWNAISEFYT